jgi:predicted kinase
MLTFCIGPTGYSEQMGASISSLLIVFSGLPGTGKTSVSKALAARIGAVYLRLDTIEQAILSAGAERVGPAGYTVANTVAVENLLLGHTVVADCVNPVRDSRVGWQRTAAEGSAGLINIYLVCSDPVEHRRRIEERSADIPGHILPTWDAVMEHEFETRDDDHWLLDTATSTPAELVDRCAVYIEGKSAER